MRRLVFYIINQDELCLMHLKGHLQLISGDYAEMTDDCYQRAGLSFFCFALKIVAQQQSTANICSKTVLGCQSVNKLCKDLGVLTDKLKPCKAHGPKLLVDRGRRVQAFRIVNTRDKKK